MATAYLHDYEVQNHRLPDVCMRCGGRAVVYQAKQFTWHPPWVIVTILFGVLPFAILALILTRRMRVYAPLCERHSSHWLKRNLSVYGGLLGLIAFGVGGIALSSNAAPGDRDAFFGLFCVGGLVLLVAWLVVVGVAQYTSIRPTEITDHRIALAGVCLEFIDAVDEAREEWRRRRREVDRDFEAERLPPTRRPYRPGDERVQSDDDRLDRPPPRPEGFREDDRG
jgi:hypothetical protein